MTYQNRLPASALRQHQAAQDNNSKSVMGYLSILNTETPNSQYCYLGLNTSNQPTQYFDIEQPLFEAINHQRKQLEVNNEYLYIWLKLDEANQILKWYLFKLPIMLWEFEPIYQACYQFESLYQLVLFGNNLKSPNLKQFFWRCFKDQALMKSFVSLPASKQHHHSFPGGLLMHSLECAKFVYSNLVLIEGMSQNEIEVTMLAALFHDIGKTHTLGQNQHSDLGRLLDHEQLTLIALADALKELTHYWKQGSYALQYLLTWTEKKGFCKFVGGNFIKMADRASTSLALRKMGFSDKPAHYYFSTLNLGNHNVYMSRLP